jgi:hypothetical protein
MENKQRTAAHDGRRQVCSTVVVSCKKKKEEKEKEEEEEEEEKKANETRPGETRSLYGDVRVIADRWTGSCKLFSWRLCSALLAGLGFVRAAQLLSSEPPVELEHAGGYASGLRQVEDSATST